MPAKNPRVKAERDVAEIYEDRYLERLARDRERTFDRRKALTLEQMRANVGLKRGTVV